MTNRNVSAGTFGKLFTREEDCDVYAQPLVRTAVSIPGSGTHNVVYVATVNNSLYAFDADSPSAQKPLWCHSREVFGDPVPKDEVTDLPPGETYLNFATIVGIVATPVIDAQSNTIHVVANSKKGNDYSFHIHAFDIATGREKREMNSPMTVGASAMGNGVRNVDGRIAFRPRKMLNRPGLLLVGGVMYLGFTSHLDGEPKFDYHGWIMACDARTLNKISVLCTTPDGIQGGIWQSGAGLAAEEREGTYPLRYAVIANGSCTGRNFGESIAQLYPGPLLSMKQAFIPGDRAYLNDHDLDLSTGPVLLPGDPFVLACSKTGDCYLVDRSDMRLETVPRVLRAFDALDLSKEHWNSEQNSARDGVGMFAKFCPAVVANGKVYLATFSDGHR